MWKTLIPSGFQVEKSEVTKDVRTCTNTANTGSVPLHVSSILSHNTELYFWEEKVRVWLVSWTPGVRTLFISKGVLGYRHCDGL